MIKNDYFPAIDSSSLEICFLANKIFSISRFVSKMQIENDFLVRKIEKMRQRRHSEIFI